MARTLHASVKKNMLALGLVVILINIALSTTVYAASPSFQEALKTWGNMLAILGSIVNLGTWAVLKFISDFLSNDFIFGNGMEEMLLSIWQTVRNFVNIAFVFVLLVTALYNIVSVDTEKFPIKQTLGKVAIALILVNFSYFAGKVVLDVANVLTAAAFSLPRDIIAENGGDESGAILNTMCYRKIWLDEADTDTSDGSSSGVATASEFTGQGYEVKTEFGRSYVYVEKNCYIPNLVRMKLFKSAENGGAEVKTAEYDEMKVILYYDKTPQDTSDNFDGSGEATDNLIDLTQIEEDLKSAGISKSQLNERIGNAALKKEDFNQENITMIIAKTMFDINTLTDVSAAAGNGFVGLTVSGVVNLAVLVMYFIMFVALFLVLLIRVIYIWLCLAFSPVIALLYVFKDFGFDVGVDIQAEFIKFAFAPAKIGLVLSVGTLMIFKTQQIAVKAGGVAGEASGGDTATAVNTTQTTFDIPIDTIFSGEMTLQRLMWNIAMVVVIWTAIKWALKDVGGPAQAVIDTLTGYVDTIGELAAKAPLALPLNPYAELGGSTLGQALQTFNPRRWEMKLDAMIDGRNVKTLDDNIKKLRDVGGVSTTEDIQTLSKVASDAEFMRSVYTDNEMRRHFVDALKKSKVFTGVDFSKAADSPAELQASLGEANKSATHRQHFSTIFGSNDVEAVMRNMRGVTTAPSAPPPVTVDPKVALQKAVTDAEAELKKLKDAVPPTDPTKITEAEAKVTQAKTALDAASH